MKILVIRFSSIGDIVLTTPVVRCLHEQLNAEVHFLTKRPFAGILMSNPHIAKVWSIEKKVSEIESDLRQERFDFIIDLHKNLRSLEVKLKLGVKSFSFNKLNIEKWLIVNFKINILPKKHIVERYLETAEKLGIRNDNRGLDFFIPEKDNVAISQFFEGKMLPFIAFVIGAAHATKRLPNDKIIDICNKIKQPILLIGGREDAENGDIITSKSSAYIQNTCGKLNLNQSASVVAQAQKVITHDTGMMHIAAAFHKEIISVWGNTVPEFGMTAYTEGGHIFEVKNLDCRPCSKIGHKECPKGHFKCMQRIDTDAIAEACK